METTTGNTSKAMQDETLLIRRILDGQTQLFRRLAGRYAMEVLRMVARLIPSQEEAEEAVQDTLLEAYCSLARYDARRLPHGTEALPKATQIRHLRRSGTTMARLHSRR